MNRNDALLLKGIAADLIEPIWRGEFYNDVEDSILYHDPEIRSNPRSEDEIDTIEAELSRLKNDLIDEIVEDLVEKGISTIDDIRGSYKEVQEICHKRFGEYRRRFWNVVEPELPPE